LRATVAASTLSKGDEDILLTQGKKEATVSIEQWLDRLSLLYNSNPTGEQKEPGEAAERLGTILHSLSKGCMAAHHAKAIEQQRNENAIRRACQVEIGSRQAQLASVQLDLAALASMRPHEVAAENATLRGELRDQAVALHAMRRERDAANAKAGERDSAAGKAEAAVARLEGELMERGSKLSLFQRELGVARERQVMSTILTLFHAIIALFTPSRHYNNAVSRHYNARYHHVGRPNFKVIETRSCRVPQTPRNSSFIMRKSWPRLMLSTKAPIHKASRRRLKLVSDSWRQNVSCRRKREKIV